MGTQDTPPPPGPPAGALMGVAPPPDASVRVLLSIARTLALLFALLAGVLFLIFLAFAFFDLFLGRGPGDLVWAVYCLASAVVNYALWREVPGLEKLASDRQYAALREHTMVWAVLGVVFFVVVGIVLLLVWVKAEMLTNPRPG